MKTPLSGDFSQWDFYWNQKSMGKAGNYYFNSQQYILCRILCVIMHGAVSFICLLCFKWTPFSVQRWDPTSYLFLQICDLKRLCLVTRAPEYELCPYLHVYNMLKWLQNKELCWVADKCLTTNYKLTFLPTLAQIILQVITEDCLSRNRKINDEIQKDILLRIRLIGKKNVANMQ